MALLALVAAAGHNLVRAVVMRWERDSARDAAAGDVEAALNVMARDLRCAFMPTDDPETLFVGRRDGAFSRCEFVLSGASNGPMEAVSYAVERDRERGRWELWRISSDARTYLCGVSRLRFRFSDGESWREDWGWDAARGEPTRGIRGLPLLVSVNIAADENETDERTRFFPLMVPVLNRSLGG